MSFNTKFSMWWGSVTTKTEKMFNKEKQRMVTHEYYDNPNAKSARPKSMHSIRGSMRMQNSARSDRASDAGSETKKRSSSKHSARAEEEEVPLPVDQEQDFMADNYPGEDAQQAQGMEYAQQADEYPQEQEMDNQQYQQYQQYNQQPYEQGQQYGQQQMAGYPSQGYAQAY